MPDSQDSYQRFAAILLGLFLLVWILFAIDPWYRDDWLLENILVFALLPALILSHTRMPLTRGSYACIFAFLTCHEIGAHYTYAEVPYLAWVDELLNTNYTDDVGGHRNHFDRFVHFLYGLLLVYPVREVFTRLTNAPGFWGYLFPLLIVMSTSMIFELFEWAAAILFGGELGMAYLGTQGDEWDAHKDMWLATCGALTATVAIAVAQKSLNRDFARECSERSDVKQTGIQY